MSKRSIASYFIPASSKKPQLSTSSKIAPSTHISYPFPIPSFPGEFELTSRKRKDKDEESKDEIEPVHMDESDDIEMLYYHPFLNSAVAKELFLFLRKELPFYRVEYKINRNGVETLVRTPRLYVDQPPILMCIRSLHCATSLLPVVVTAGLFLEAHSYARGTFVN